MTMQTIAILSLAITMPVLGQELADTQTAERRDGAVVAADYDYRATVSACSIAQSGGETMLTATVQGMPAHSDIITGAGMGMGPHVRGMVQKGRENAVEVIASNGRVAAGPGGGPHVRVFSGVDFTIASSPGGGMPLVTAMAINEKGSGATSNARMLLPAVQKIRDAAARSASGTTASLACTPGYSEARAASCSVSGNPDAPDLTFTIPLSALGEGGGGGDARHTKTGHVTLMKRGRGGAMRATASLSDGSSVVATCTSDGKMIATYDLKALKK